MHHSLAAAHGRLPSQWFAKQLEPRRADAGKIQACALRADRGLHLPTVLSQSPAQMGADKSARARDENAPRSIRMRSVHDQLDALGTRVANQPHLQKYR